MSREKEQVLAEVNTGKTAGFVLAHLKTDLARQERDVIAKMKSMYRDGSYTEVKLLASVAELCTLEDIENRLVKRIKKGETAFVELNDAP